MSSRPPRFERQIEQQTGIINPAAGGEHEIIASELMAFSQRRAAQFAQDREQAAFQEGQQVGAAGGAADRREWNRANRAFNKGVLVSHQAALQTDVRDQISRFHLESPADPEAFMARVEGLRTGLGAEVDPRLRPFVEQRIADYAGRAQIQIVAEQQKQLRAEAVKDLQRGAEGFLEDATTAAFEGDINLVEARRQELQALLGDALEGELIDEADTIELMDNFERQITAQEVVGNFDRLVRERGPEASVEAIRRWQEAKPSELGLSVEQHEAVTRQLIGLKNRESALLADQRAREAAAADAERRFRVGRVNDAVRVMQRGFAPDKDQMEAIAGDIEWLADPELAHKVDVAGAIQEQVHRFRRMPDPLRSEELNRLEGALRREGATVETIELLDALQRTHADVSKQLEQDARGYVVREGLLADEPLSFESGQALVESLEARAAGAEMGTSLTGQTLPRLTADEADQIAELYQGLEVEDKVGVLAALTSGAGDDALQTLAQIDQQGHASMALVGGMVMQGQGRLARDIIRGQGIVAATPAIKPSTRDLSPDVENIWGAAMTDWPEQRQVYLDAAIAKYAQLKQADGDLSEVYNTRRMAQALREVMPTARFNGRSVAVPPGMTERDFRRWQRTWGDEQFDGVAGIAPDALRELVQRRGRLVEAGLGRYGVVIPSAVDGREKPLVRTDGTMFVLEIPREPQQ